MAKNGYASYPDGYKRLMRELKIPLLYRLAARMIMPAFVKILIDG